MMADYENMRKTVEECCLSLGITDWELAISSSRSVSASMTGREFTDFSSSFDTSAVVRVLKGKKEGCASSDRVDEDVIRTLCRKALENCQAKEIEDDFSPVINGPDKSYADVNRPDVSFHNTADLKKAILAAQEKLLNADSRVSCASESQAASITETNLLFNSRGLDLSDSSTASYIASEAVVTQAGETKDAYVIRDSLDGDTSQAVTKALDKLSSSLVKSGKYRIVFSNECMNLFLSAFASAFSGKNAFLGLSPYRDSIGKQVASEAVTLVDNPLYEGYAFQKSFDAEGLPAYCKNVIEKGVLKTLLYNGRWAQKAGCAPTANAVLTSGGSEIRPYSFYIEKGNISIDDLFGKTGYGILVTQMKGFHAGANAVSGDFSIESSGFLIKDGKKAQAISGFTVAGNFFSMLTDIEAVSDDLYFNVTLSSYRTGSPSVLVKELSVAGT